MFWNSCTPDRRDTPDLSDVPLLEINITPEYMLQLKRKRAEALRDGLLVSKAKDYVSAQLIHQHDTMAAEVRLKGDWLDHLKGGKWSLRMKLGDAAAFMGMRRFSIQHPRTRSYLDEWVYHRLLEEEGILTTRYEWVQVVLNGRYKGLYAVEEHFDKTLLERQGRRAAPILKFSEDGFWQIQEYHQRKGANLSPYLPEFEAASVEAFQKGGTLRDSMLRTSFLWGREALEAYRWDEQPATELWDINQMARLYALADICSAYHSLRWHNMRVYFNPISGRLEPVVYDAYSSNGPYFWFSKPYLDYYDERRSKVYFAEEYIIFKLLNEEVFRERYYYYLEKYSDPAFLQQFFKSISTSLNQYEKALQLEYPSYQYQDSLLVKGAQKMRNYLDSIASAHLPFEYTIFEKLYDSCRIASPLTAISLKAERSGRSDQILLTNYFCQPIQIEATGPKKSKPRHRLDQALPIPPFDIYQSPPKAVSLTIDPTDRYVFYTTAGHRHWFTKKISTWPARITPDFIDKEALQIDSSAIEFDGSRLVIERGIHPIEKNWIIPAGYDLIVKAGAELQLLNGAALLVFGGVRMQGTVQDPILITSPDRSGRGVHLLQTKRLVSLEQVQFSDLKTIHSNGFWLTGGVTLYQVQGTMKHCRFLNSQAEDALNIINCDNLELAHLQFSNCQSDGLDIDFSKVNLSDSRFYNIRGDGLDCSGSTITAEELTFADIVDKAISIGENTHCSLRQVQIARAGIGMAVKDGSRAILEDATIEDSEIGLAVFRKKPEYDSARLQAAHTELLQLGQRFYLEEGHQFVLDQKKLEPTHKPWQISSLLYVEPE